MTTRDERFSAETRIRIFLIGLGKDVNQIFLQQKWQQNLVKIKLIRRHCQEKYFYRSDAAPKQKSEGKM
jgi:hypothetical protein